MIDSLGKHVLLWWRMKTILLAMAALGLTAMSNNAQTATVQQEAATATVCSGAVGKAIEKIDFITEHKPNTQAKYYMYLCSAYWCGPCRREMPNIIAEYEEMKKDNHVEIILLSCDHHVKGALQYLDLFAAPFAAVMYESEARKQLPGAPDDIRGVPHIYVVDADGNFVHRGHGSTSKSWREYTKKNK